jgi:hypothetical protein
MNSTSVSRNTRLPPFTARSRIVSEVTKMGRKIVLFGFWLLGYSLGFFAWLVRTPIINGIMGLGISSDVAGAMITGFASSIMMLVGVLLWSFLSRG